MLKPIDPRNNGLKKPEKVFTIEDEVIVYMTDRNQKIPLKMFVDSWEKTSKGLEALECRVIEGPFIEGGYSYGVPNRLTFKYEQDNRNYEAEKAAWDTALATYDQELAAWKTFDAERKQALDAVQVKSIDAQIERAEHRLANLKAVKAGEPMPFPKG